MHIFGHLLSLRLVIGWALACLATGGITGCVLFVTLHNRGSRAAPRQLRKTQAETLTRWRANAERARALIERRARRQEPPSGPAALSVALRERVLLPWTPPAPLRISPAASAPRVVPDVISLADRVGMFYVRADSPVAWTLNQAGWRSW